MSNCARQSATSCSSWKYMAPSSYMRKYASQYITFRFSQNSFLFSSDAGCHALSSLCITDS